MKIIRTLLIVLILVGLAAASWYYRPWAEYSPSRVASLQEPEHLVFNFQNMHTLIPYSEVRKGDSVDSFNEQLGPLELEYSYAGERKSLQQFLQDSKTMGLMVVKNGTVLHEQY